MSASRPPLYDASNEEERIPLGVSQCLLGDPVRYDGGHKRLRFLTDVLAPWVRFVPVCPELAIGMGVPRPPIRLVETASGLRLQGVTDAGLDVTEAMHRFADRKVPELADLCGYVVCAKSPSCGLARVPVYKPGAPVGERRGTGLWTRRLRAAMPWLPVEENGRLEDPALRENFVLRLFALRDFYRSLPEDARAADYVAFHSRYKYTLMAAAPSRAQALGRLVARIEPRPGAAFWRAYRQAFMAALATTASRGRHANVLMHLQGYFKRVLPPAEKAYLGALIEAYRRGEQPLAAVLAVIRGILLRFPNPYLERQHYLEPFPAAIARRADGAG